MPDARTHEAKIDPNNSPGALASRHFFMRGLVAREIICASLRMRKAILRIDLDFQLAFVSLRAMSGCDIKMNIWCRYRRATTVNDEKK